MPVHRRSRRLTIEPAGWMALGAYGAAQPPQPPMELPGMDDQNHCCHCGMDLGVEAVEGRPNEHGPDSIYYEPSKTLDYGGDTAAGLLAESEPPTEPERER